MSFLIFMHFTSDISILGQKRLFKIYLKKDGGGNIVQKSGVFS